jgi:TRAP-type C4-dicarboxylate transport system permease large subunit
LLLLLNVFLLIAGALLDPTCILIIFSPVLAPLVKSFGINEIHFGIVMILNVMIGNLTPPLGGIMFVTCKVAEVKMSDFLRECWPFICWLVAALLIVTYVPQTVTWLPSLFMK